MREGSGRFYPGGIRAVVEAISKAHYTEVEITDEDYIGTGMARTNIGGITTIGLNDGMSQRGLAFNAKGRSIPGYGFDGVEVDTLLDDTYDLATNDGKTFYRGKVYHQDPFQQYSETPISGFIDTGPEMVLHAANPRVVLRRPKRKK